MLRDKEIMMRFLTRILLLSVLCIGLMSCDDDQETIDSIIAGRSWTGDIGMVDEFGEPLISTFSFGYDGFGKETQYYEIDGVFYDSYRFQWLWEDSYSRNLILDYGRNGVSYMDNVRVSGGRMYGTFYIDDYSEGFDFVLYME